MSQARPGPEAQPGSHPASYLGRLPEIARRVWGKYYDGTHYRSETGISIARNLNQAARFSNIIHHILPPAEILVGVENPQEQLRREIAVAARRFAAFIPSEEFQHQRRGRDHTLSIQTFQRGFVDVFEELANGTKADGSPTQLSLLSKFVQYGLRQLPQPVQEDVLQRDEHGRLHLQNDQELSAVAGIRESRVGGVLNKALPKERPITAQRAITAVAGEIAIGIVGGYYNMLAPNAPEREQIGNAWQWLKRYRAAFDQEINGKLDGTLVKLFSKIAPNLAKTIIQLNDYRQFLREDLPTQLPDLLQLLPKDQEQVGAFRQILAGFKTLTQE